MAQPTYVAGCVITGPDQSLLLIHRNAPGKLQQWMLPGGHVELDQGETGADAAKREAKEEIGVDVEIVEYLGKTSFSATHQATNYDFEWHKAEIIGGEPRIQNDERDEFDACNYIPVREMSELPLSQSLVLLLAKCASGEITLF